MKDKNATAAASPLVWHDPGVAPSETRLARMEQLLGEINESLAMLARPPMLFDASSFKASGIKPGDLRPGAMIPMETWPPPMMNVPPFVATPLDRSIFEYRRAHGGQEKYHAYVELLDHLQVDFLEFDAKNPPPGVLGEEQNKRLWEALNPPSPPINSPSPIDPSASESAIKGENAEENGNPDDFCVCGYLRREHPFRSNRTTICFGVFPCEPKAPLA